MKHLQFNTKIITILSEDNVLINTFTNYIKLHTITSRYEKSHEEILYIILLEDDQITAIIDDIVEKVTSIEETLNPTIDIESFDLNKTKDYKIKEIGKTCEKTIFSGVDITLSSGTIKHYSLTIADQLNILGIQQMVAQGLTQIPYHADGESCEIYSLEDALKIITGAMEYKTYHVTLCNQFNTWIRRLETKKDILEIEYATKLPDDLAANMNDILTIKGESNEIQV